MASRATLRSHEPVHPCYDYMPTRMPLSYGHGSEQVQVKENFPVMNLNHMVDISANPVPFPPQR
jgi:hypothetical protein